MSLRITQLCGFGRALTAGGNYWGTGAEGAVTISADTTVGDATDDDASVVMNYSSLTIDATYNLTTAARKRALVIYVEGNCVINGILHMDGQGAAATATDKSDLYRDKSGGGTSTGSPNTDIFPEETMEGGDDNIEVTAAQAGAAGGTPGTSTGGTTGAAGSAGVTNQSGGGGAGGASSMTSLTSMI